MPKFEFRLATLLRVRTTLRDDRRTEVAEALRAATTLDERLAEVRRNWEAARQLHTVAAGPVNVDRLLDAQRYELLLDFEQRGLQGQRRQVLAEVERRREALLAADRDVRVLEKLREHQFQQHRAQAQRREMQRLDEVAGISHQRQEEPL